MLYLVATPIGNLKDITFRAIETLKAVDYILCEDTRHSLSLLNHYAIQKPLKSFHKFNETSKEELIIADLKAGKSIALISDAGTPGISDPGEKLVKRCKEEGILVSPIPGSSALIAAISVSGLKSTHFQFCGFLPKKAKELRSFLQGILNSPATAICYESPKRLLSTLKALQELAPNRPTAIARELTKKFEEILKGYPSELISHFENKEIKGEIVLLIEGQQVSEKINFEHLSPKEHVEMLQESYHLSKNEAIKMAASLRGVPKRTIYKDSLE